MDMARSPTPSRPGAHDARAACLRRPEHAAVPVARHAVLGRDPGLMRIGWRRGGGPVRIDHDPDPRPDEVERWR